MQIQETDEREICQKLLIRLSWTLFSNRFIQTRVNLSQEYLNSDFRSRG